MNSSDILVQSIKKLYDLLSGLFIRKVTV